MKNISTPSISVGPQLIAFASLAALLAINIYIIYNVNSDRDRIAQYMLPCLLQTTMCGLTIKNKHYRISGIITNGILVIIAVACLKVYQDGKNMIFPDLPLIFLPYAQIVGGAIIWAISVTVNSIANKKATNSPDA